MAMWLVFECGFNGCYVVSSDVNLNYFVIICLSAFLCVFGY